MTKGSALRQVYGIDAYVGDWSVPAAFVIAILIGLPIVCTALAALRIWGPHALNRAARVGDDEIDGLRWKTPASSGAVPNDHRHLYTHRQRSLEIAGTREAVRVQGHSG